MSHIFERFFIHFAASTFITLAFFFVLRFLSTKYINFGIWVSGHKEHLLVTSALCVFAMMPLREPFDTAFGTQVWYKAIFDQISWFVGPAVAVFGLYRYGKIK